MRCLCEVGGEWRLVFYVNAAETLRPFKYIHETRTYALCSGERYAELCEVHKLGAFKHTHSHSNSRTHSEIAVVIYTLFSAGAQRMWVIQWGRSDAATTNGRMDTRGTAHSHNEWKPLRRRRRCVSGERHVTLLWSSLRRSRQGIGEKTIDT